MIRTHRRKLEMTPDAMVPVIRVSQYDSAFQIIFELVSHYTELTIGSGITAKVRGTKTDAKGYSANASINTSAKTVTVTGDIQMTAVPGKCIYEIVLYEGSKEVSSINFILAVEPAALDASTIPSESKILEIQEIGQKADQIIEAYENLTFDQTPTSGSQKAVTSDGIYKALSQQKLAFADANSNGNIVITIGAGS